MECVSVKVSFGNSDERFASGVEFGAVFLAVLSAEGATRRYDDLAVTVISDLEEGFEKYNTAHCAIFQSPVWTKGDSHSFYI